MHNVLVYLSFLLQWPIIEMKYIYYLGKATYLKNNTSVHLSKANVILQFVRLVMYEECLIFMGLLHP